MQLSIPIQKLIKRSLCLARLLLKHRCQFYPFAAVIRGDDIDCLFSEHASDSLSPSYLLELLQWQVIDATTGTNSISVIVYNADVNLNSGSFDAIAMCIRKPNGDEIDLLYPYHNNNGSVVISPPVTD